MVTVYDPPSTPTKGKILGTFSLTGENSLKSYDGSILENGDAAIVFTQANTRIYNLVADSGALEDTHKIIAPQSNAGLKRWVLVSFEESIFSNDLIPDISNVRVIGTSTKQWKELYLKKTLFLNGLKLIEEVDGNFILAKVNMNGETITGLKDPIETSDAATKKYVDEKTTDASTITSGTLPSSVMPPIAITSVQVATSQAVMLSLTTQEGDVVVRSDINKSYMHNAGSTGTIADFTELQTPGNSVLSVNAKTGSVILTQDTVGDGATYKRSTASFTPTLLATINNIPTNYLKSNQSTTHSVGLMTVSMVAGVSGSSLSTPSTGFQIFQPTLGADAFATFHIGGDYAAHFGLDGTTNDWFVGGWSMGAVKHKVFHAGNTPLPNTAAVVSTIVQRDSAADITTRLFATTLPVASRSSDTVFYSGVDDYIRKNTAAGMLNSLGLTNSKIIASGIGANGSFTKFGDGTIIQSGTTTQASGMAMSKQYFPLAYTNSVSIGVSITVLTGQQSLYNARIAAYPIPVDGFTWGVTTYGDTLAYNQKGTWNSIGR